MNVIIINGGVVVITEKERRSLLFEVKENSFKGTRLFMLLLKVRIKNAVC
jgi:hypothetical protein